jgi:hypothetical protein
MQKRRDMNMKPYSILAVALCVFCLSCSATLTTTGEPGISMGDSYEKVIETLKPDNKITKTIVGAGIRAEGFSTMTNDCRIKYFIFQGKDGLQHVKYEPAKHLSVDNNCQ